MPPGVLDFGVFQGLALKATGGSAGARNQGGLLARVILAGCSDQAGMSGRDGKCLTGCGAGGWMTRIKSAIKGRAHQDQMSVGDSRETTILPKNIVGE